MDRICEYGCNRKANHQFKNGKWCCENYSNKCPAVIENHKKRNSGKKRNPQTRENLSAALRGKKQGKPVKLESSSELCSYDCGNAALYYFPISKKYCCCDHHSKCPSNRKKNSERLLNHHVSIETKRKISKKISDLNKHDKKYKRKQSESRKINYKKFLREHPFFTSIENPRINEHGEMVVHCKFCNQEFIPTHTQIYERVRQLEHENGKDGCYLYCSDDCKNKCPLFNLIPTIETQKEKYYSDSEYQTFRQYVLERDNFICQFCGEKATHVHHERPQKLEPFFSLDPDYAWSCCEKCHYGKGHPIESKCSTSNLSKIICT